MARLVALAIATMLAFLAITVAEVGHHPTGKFRHGPAVIR
jgi:hypothetical protein